jgi:hypothetical protein
MIGPSQSATLWVEFEPGTTKVDLSQSSIAFPNPTEENPYETRIVGIKEMGPASFAFDPRCPHGHIAWGGEDYKNDMGGEETLRSKYACTWGLPPDAIIAVPKV